MKRSINKFISGILMLSIIFSLAATCFSVSTAASSTLKNSRDLLGEYIAELYLKGPAVSSSVRENLIDKGLDKDGLLEKRAEFDLRLCSSDVNDGYFFTNKEEFLDIFGKNDFVLLENVYTWYAGVPEAKKAGLGITQNDPLIRYNISNALNFAIDVYGFCEEDSLDILSDKFDTSRKNLVSFAIDCIYKIITALEDQIGEGTNKPLYYKAEFSDTFCSTASGLYPYLDVRFKKNTPVMTGYYDQDAYKEKTHDYSSLQNSIETNALLSVFETAYANLHAQKDGGVLYYDFLTSYENVRISYFELCSAVIKTEVTKPDITEKAKAYLKLKSLGEIFAKYILPYSDVYSEELNAMSINYTTIKTLIHFVGNNPYFLHSISLSAMQDLINNFTQSISRLSPMPEYVLTTQLVADNAVTVSKMNDYLGKYEGVVGEKNKELFNKAKDILNTISAITTSGVNITVPKTYFYGSNENIVEGESFTFSVVPSTALYLGLINEAKILCGEFSEQVDPTIPTILTANEKETLPIKNFINEYSFILGIHQPIICPATGIISQVETTEPAKAILKTVLKEEWSSKIPDDEKLLNIDVIFSAAAEYYAYKNGLASEFLISQETSSLASFREYLNDSDVIYDMLLSSVAMAEKDVSQYKLALNYIISNIAEIWRLKQDTINGHYYSSAAVITSDGKDPANLYNYKTDALTSMINDLNGLMTVIKNSDLFDKSSANLFISDKKLTASVKKLLSDYGIDCYNDFRYDLFELTSLYYGKEDLTGDIFKTIIGNKGCTLNRYIVVDSNGQVSSSEQVYKYFAFTVSAVSKDSSRANNLYSFDGNRIMTNLITPLDVILKNKATYIGNYARDKAEEIEKDMQTAQMLVSSVNEPLKSVGYEITVAEASDLLAKLSEVNFTLSNYTLSYIASYKASVLDAIIDRARAKTIDQTDTTPYYKLICDRFQSAYSNALNVSRDKTVPIEEISYAAETLTAVFNALENYSKATSENIITVKDLETKISEADELLARYDIPTKNSYIDELSAAIDAAKDAYNKKLSTFTVDELNLVLRTLDSAIAYAKNSILIGPLMKAEIAKITASVKEASEYTSDSWAIYASALSKANLASASSTEKVSVCNSLIEELKLATALLKPASDDGEEEKEDTTVVPQPSTPPVEEPDNTETDSNADAFYAQANDIYVKSVAELAAYVLTSPNNTEKIAVWTAALENLKDSIDNKKDQATVVANIVAIQLAKDMQIENPETQDN